MLHTEKKIKDDSKFFIENNAKLEGSGSTESKNSCQPRICLFYENIFSRVKLK